MNGILTLQELPDLDTFTLEEKIEELQQHPHVGYYHQLIALAKIELEERYKVQQFGRKLINDEIPIFPDLCFSKIKTEAKAVNPPVSADRSKKINFAQCLKRSLITDETLFIKKSAVGNYRYKPTKTIEEKPKKQKKSMSYGSQQNINNKKKPGLPSFCKKNTLQTVSSKDTIESLPPISSSSSLKRQTPKEEPFRKQQLQRTGKKVEIRYIENDVYDEKPFLDNPQKLANISFATSVDKGEEEKSELVDLCEINTEIENDQHDEYIDNLSQIIEEEIVVVENTEEKKRDWESIVDEQQLEVNERNDQFGKEQVGDHQAFNVEQREEITKLEVQERHEEQIQQQQSEKRSPCTIKLNVKPNKNKNNYISQKIFTAVTSTNKEDEIEFVTPLNKQKQKKQQERMMRKTVTVFPKQSTSSSRIKKQGTGTLSSYPSTQRIKEISPSIYPYHEHIPNFSKLFPHSCSGSLINDLRAIEEQLHSHIKKKITKIALSDEYLRIRDQQLLFKVISESEKAQKYGNLFDIEVQSFMRRAKIMLGRINATKSIGNGQYEEQNEKCSENILLYRVVRQKEDVYDIVNNTFHRTKQWYELPHGMELKTSWNLLWTWSRPQIDLKYLCHFQKVNHFFGNKQIARKDLLKKNIEKIKKLGKKASHSFDIIPETFYLPGENMQFIRKFRECAMREGSLNYWILKPVGMSRGRGIELVNKIEDIVFNEPVVLQKYLMNPLLLNGHKFDLRIYVLVTSINPLEAYIYNEGFARISTQKYSTDEEDLSNKFIHLTNFSVQKEGIGEESANKQQQTFPTITCMTPLQKQLGGCKITLKSLKHKLEPRGIDWEQSIRPQIDSIILKSLISTMNLIEPNPNCFQLFGYDIMIDENLKCWLIEVNSSPSLEKDFTIDEIVKQQLVDDIIQIVNPLPYDRERLLEVVTRRRKEMQGLKSHINHNNNSMQQLNSDLQYILHGRTLEKKGCSETPNFRQVAPGPIYQNIIDLVQQYKRESIVKKS